MLVESEFLSPDDELDKDEPEPTVPAAPRLCLLHDQRSSRVAQSPTDQTLPLPVLSINSGSESPTSPSQSHPDTLDVFSPVETSAKHEARTQNLLNDVADRIGPDICRPEEGQTGSLEQSEHVSFVDAVALLSELEMVLPCCGDVHSKFERRFLDLGAGASAAVWWTLF